MQFAVLGPVMITEGKGLARIVGSTPRSVLAALLLSANRMAAAESLINVVWGDDPPATAMGSLQNQVSRLRRTLGPEASRLQTISPGYMLKVGEGELDLDTFERLSVAGRRALEAGEWEAASRDLRAALELWRGDALADVSSPVLREREAPRLEGLRLDVVEARIEADLHLGRHEELVGELAGLVAVHPLRERLYGHLMVAYCRAGRHAEALAVFARAREVLAEELGVDPGPGLQELHQRVLTGDADLKPSRSMAGSPARLATLRPLPRLLVQPRQAGRALALPAQLPAGLADFTGRSEDVAWLTGVLASAGEQSGVVPTGVVTGLGGTGKTSLAVHVAHQVSGQFPDGQLFAGLSKPRGCPVAAADVLGGFLRALGVAADRLPDTEAERAAMLRSVLAGRRVLVVLDDARNSPQVAPLLPGTAGCAVIVTTRGLLPGLPGGQARGLGPLTDAESAALLTEIIGEHRARPEPGAVAKIVGFCGGLPLALRIAGDRLVARPQWRLADLVTRLASPAGRLDALTIGGVSVRAAFEGSCAALPGGQDGALARALRLLAPLDGEDVTPEMAAPLLGSNVPDAEATLDVLADAHLLQPGVKPGLYRIPPLLGAYAAETGVSPDRSRRGLQTYADLSHAGEPGTYARVDPLSASGRRARRSGSRRPFL
jgi:pentatricopeptide repeat protein